MVIDTTIYYTSFELLKILFGITEVLPSYLRNISTN